MLFNYMFTFMVGSFLGYFLELFYRKFKHKKWIKPGVFKGAYLPLYGLGLCISYFMFLLEIDIIFKVIFSIILLTFIELICGLIFIWYFEIPLWDYSKNTFNYKGLICLKFSACWGFLSFIFISFVFPYVNFSFANNNFIIFIIYIFHLVLLIDIVYSMNNYINKKLRGN